MWSTRADPFNNFLTALSLLVNGEDMDDLIVATLREVQASAQMLAEACVVTPKQFWKCADLYCSVIVSAPQEARCFRAGVEGFRTLGGVYRQSRPSVFADALLRLRAVQAGPHSDTQPSQAPGHPEAAARLRAAGHTVARAVHQAPAGSRARSLRLYPLLDYSVRERDAARRAAAGPILLLRIHRPRTALAQDTRGVRRNDAGAVATSGADRGRQFTPAATAG